MEQDDGGISAVVADDMVSNDEDGDDDNANLSENLDLKNEQGPRVLGNELQNKNMNGVGRTVFVRNLNWFTTDAEIEEEVCKYGPVNNIKIFEQKNGKSRGYCRVEFSDPVSAAACKEKMNGHVFSGGQPCVVHYSSPYRGAKKMARGCHRGQVGLATNNRMYAPPPPPPPPPVMPVPPSFAFGRPLPPPPPPTMMNVPPPFTMERCFNPALGGLPLPPPPPSPTMFVPPFTTGPPPPPPMMPVTPQIMTTFGRPPPPLPPPMRRFGGYPAPP